MTIAMFILAALTVVLASWGAISRSFKRSMILTWCAGLVLGLIFLLSGAEILALAVWFLGTLTLILLYVYSTMFGDLLEKSECQELFQDKKELALPIAGALMTAVLLGLGLLPWLRDLPLEMTFHPVSFASFSRFMFEKESLTVLLTAFGILLLLVGSAVIARADWSLNEKEER